MSTMLQREKDWDLSAPPNASRQRRTSIYIHIHIHVVNFLLVFLKITFVLSKLNIYMWLISYWFF